ncbi:hypothetical protein IGI04_015039 [Brassica rapa subsp. trilocularis]|uniref:Uncharacterized protein n=1 Tax=Brassica rapa subsp. trilocularis TaxID=1813537 RepID=A0ABQ7MP14_BRACM|nr:hypothetical protein IGI04_015039 [Brassica rapa subsp. trilocularis]
MTPTTNTGEQSPRQFSVVSLESHNNNNPYFISSPNIIIKSIFQSEKTQTLFRRFPSAAVFLLLRLRRRGFQRRAVAQQQQETEHPCSVQRWDHPAVPRLGVGISLFDQSPEQSSRVADSQLRTVGGKVYERLSLLLQPFDVKINSFAKNPKSLISYLEAILSRAFFENFELLSFQVSENGSTRILNPSDRCESNYASFNVLMELTWDEVLSRGTKHFSEKFSRFCDRKNECHVTSMLCWNRAWPEPLLQLKKNGMIFAITSALSHAGLEPSNLIVGSDVPKRNKWTGVRLFGRNSLHYIGITPNPYQQAISVIGKTLLVFDEDNLIP